MQETQVQSLSGKIPEATGQLSPQALEHPMLHNKGSHYSEKLPLATTGESLHAVMRSSAAKNKQNKQNVKNKNKQKLSMVVVQFYIPNSSRV